MGGLIIGVFPRILQRQTIKMALRCTICAYDIRDTAIISPLRYKNAELKVLLALSSMIIGVMSTSPVTPIIISLLGLAIIYLNKVPVKIYLKLLLIPGTF